jgi:DNA damage-binding protein 1
VIQVTEEMLTWAIVSFFESQTLYATVDGSIGSVIGLDARTTSFFLALQQSMNRVIVLVGKLKHDAFRSYHGQRKHQSCRGFVDGDLIESFCELDLALMDAIVSNINKDGR